MRIIVLVVLIVFVVFYDNIPMCIAEIKEYKVTHNQIWNAIDMFAREHSLSCSGLAKISGLDPTTFNKSKRFSRQNQPRWPSMYSIAKILNATGASITDFCKLIPDKKKQ